MLTEVNKGDYMISKASEEYLKTIYILNNKNGFVRVTDIAEKLNCTKPSVTKQLNILRDAGMIEYAAYKDITLTSLGINYSKKILEAYDIIYLLMHDVIGLDEDESKCGAEQVKSVLKDETLNKIAKYVYKTLGLDISNCSYNLDSEKCRSCVKHKKLNKDKEV